MDNNLTYICNACKLEKPAEEFGKCAAKKNGVRSWCKQCCRDAMSKYRQIKPQTRKLWDAAHKEKIRQYSKTYNEKTKESRRIKSLQKRYGLSIEQYNLLLVAQNNGCAICGSTNNNRPLFVDHNHTTGELRALLCSTCNSALGMLNENVELILKMVDYINKYK